MPLARTLVLILLLAVPFAARADTDRSDPAAVAGAFLTAYQARDLPALAVLVNKHNQRMFDALAQGGKDHPAYAEVFSGWRAEAADAWDGATLETRYDGAQAVVRFGDMVAGETAVVVLSDEDGWAVTDINSPDRADFDALPTAR